MNCEHNSLGSVTCEHCGKDEHDHLVERAEKAEAEVARLRAALEEIAEGVGCGSKYGPGCDTHCKTIAHRALSGSS